jgi:putative nucleotidyltransferase with HDIG domain
LDSQQQLDTRVKELTSLLEATKQLSSAIELEDVLTNVLRQMVEVVKGEAGTLWIYDQDSESIRAAAVEGPSSDVIRHIRLQPGEGIVGRVVSSKEPHLIEDVTRDSAWAKRVDDESGFVTRSMMTVPLITKGAAIGAMQLLNKQGGNLFDKDDLRIALALAHQSALALQNAQMYDEMYRMSISIIRTLAKMVDARDPYTAGHSGRVSQYSIWIAQRLGWSEPALKELERAALLHDIGKIGVPDRILMKSSRLTDEEFAWMKRHTTIGAEILQHMEPKRLMKDACETAHYHHERLDGSGYPKGLKGTEVPPFARVVAIADSFDAMTTVRPYSNGRSYFEAIQDLMQYRGKLYDPEMVDIFAEILKANGYLLNGNDRTPISASNEEDSLQNESV